jgi:CubicO group peptidase (beta-lactamase class C family)
MTTLPAATVPQRATLLPRADPADVGVPVTALDALLDELATRSLELHSLMVVRQGRVAAEGWWAPYSPERVHLLYSLSKSFTSSAVAFCLA